VLELLEELLDAIEFNLMAVRREPHFAQVGVDQFVLYVEDAFAA
jgi:hypothetical protein